MGKNNKANRARKERKRKAKVKSSATGGIEVSANPRYQGTMFSPSGSPLPEGLEMVYADEPDITLLCRHCREMMNTPVFAYKVPSDYSLAQINVRCGSCGQGLLVKPRKGITSDGFTLHWVDRSVVDEWVPPESVNLLQLQHRETGEILTIGTGGSKNVFWALCDDCGLPFRSSGDLSLTVREGSALVPDLTVAGCEHCDGVGRTLMTRVEGRGLTTYANSPTFANVILDEIAELLRTGKIDVAGAAQMLRKQKHPAASRLADWLEKRPVSAAVACTLLTILAGFVGQQLKQDAPAPVVVNVRNVEKGFSEEEVKDLLESVLEHYDRIHADKQGEAGTSAPRPAQTVG